ncbi:hypothetical protein BBJ29_010129 [Phytophthora kernoviae]|uniref:FHA domain-containing protein n=1 Tax=Phytophthora kernoviae TaxID=325452 RepID=A0A3F2RWC7_9STRA|nr:hypothetical protein BBJ29_010129 [Phytophthora kernoviae]RLN65512.1 hypothetical protein BBP00_00002809 [Phytophthora kernoviae]
MLRDITMGSWEFTSAFCVGRSRGCEVSIATSEETRTVSKRHVGVTPLAETLADRAGATLGKRRWLLYDLETMNGTAVNGVELSSGGNCELRDGDEVVLASAMRQCVRLVVQFPDDACSRIVVKAVARSATPSPAPSHHRSPRRAVVPNAAMTSPGFSRSAATHANKCRDIVKTVPVRNRALDELVERLVGNTEAYKSHVRRRAKLQRRSVGPRRYEHNGDTSEQGEDDESEGAARGVGSLQLGNGGVPEPTLRSSVFARWSVEEKLAFSAYIGTQFGETRAATCKKVGLTEAAVESATMTDMIVASQNLLLDCGGLRIAGDECCQRLKIFLLFG